MSTSYPYGIDVYVNPTATDHLNDVAVPHDAQHSNINDAMTAVQNWIGVSASMPMTGGLSHTIEFRIHNIYSGHSHDGFNSKPAALGPPTVSGSLVSGSYPYLSGIFYFTSTTPAGHAVDQINQYLVQVSSSLASIITGTFNSRQLLLLSEDPGGPFEGFEPGAYRELGYINHVFITQSIWYVDASKTKKILQTNIAYNRNKTISSITQSAYSLDGVTVIKTAIDTIYYSGIIETYRTRSIF